MADVSALTLLILGVICSAVISTEVVDFKDLGATDKHNLKSNAAVLQNRIPKPSERPYWENFGIFDSSSCSVDKKLKKEIKGYQEIVEAILSKTVNGNFKGETFKHLAHFTDSFGSRMVTTPEYGKAVAFLTRQLLNIPTLTGRVFVEDVQIPNWKRIRESAEITLPIQKTIDVFGMGLTVPTPARGIEAEVIVVDSLEELRINKYNIGGKILVFNMNFEETQSILPTAASRGALLGAAATLVRSAAPFSIYSLHAALLQYSDKARKIPAATINLEDAELLSRLYKKGKRVMVKLLLENTDPSPSSVSAPPAAQQVPSPIPSPYITTQNLLGDFDGREFPNQYVLVSGGLDSFDIGQGAIDGLGAILTYELARIFDDLKLYPRRTVRAAFWTGSKFGHLGAQKYLDNHETDFGRKYSAALGANLGCMRAKGFIFSGPPQAACIVQEILRLFPGDMIEANLIHVNGTVSDVSWFSNPFIGISNSPAGVPSMTLNGDDGHLYWFMNSNGDTPSAFESSQLDICLGLYTAVTYVLADLTDMLPH